MSELQFERSSGVLVWGAHRYRATSGPYGKGALSAGNYEVMVRDVVVGTSLGSGFRDKITGAAWFIPINAKFQSTRHGLGIHPDGNVPGTKGCVGLQGDDASEFWHRWLDTPLTLRPTRLLVQ